MLQLFSTWSSMLCTIILLISGYLLYKNITDYTKNIYNTSEETIHTLSNKITEKVKNNLPYIYEEGSIYIKNKFPDLYKEGSNYIRNQVKRIIPEQTDLLNIGQ